jgi:exopolysaccharide production protein ExoY
LLLPGAALNPYRYAVRRPSAPNRAAARLERAGGSVSVLSDRRPDVQTAPSRNGTGPHANGCGPSESESLAHVAALMSQARRKRRRPLRWKRLLDLAVGIPLFLVTLPVIAAAALSVWLVDRHWPFYADTRIGRHGRPFRCLKLRTMLRDPRILDEYLAANPDESLSYRSTRKLRSDPRVTRLGSFYRRSSIDELPQIVNVLRGEMSLVGPRPLAATEFLERGVAAIPLTWAPPGVTGLWQVKGRSDTSLRRRIALDNYYVRHASPLMDLRILVETPFAVITARGAR